MTPPIPRWLAGYHDVAQTIVTSTFPNRHPTRRGLVAACDRVVLRVEKPTYECLHASRSGLVESFQAPARRLTLDKMNGLRHMWP